MKYAIAWAVAADEQLMTIWMDAEDRGAVTAAAGRLLDQLTYRPLSVGESRESSVSRFATDPPVGFLYEVIEDDKKVVVQKVFLVQSS